ncbi:MAG: amidohydrolase [Alphaproteobacteria bacterium]|nr:amidohydrolase [Alphaproteobacteria bacterium]
MPDPIDSLTGVVSPQLFEQLLELRRDLHKHPELSWEEQRTAARIAAQLRGFGLEPRSIGGTGLVVDLPGLDPDLPMVALRADTDALPITEETGLPWASVNAGVMHACGHDGHSTMLVGATRLLLDAPPPGPVRVFWQPAEEKAAGAVRLIEEGVLEGVEMIFGGHVDRHYQPGTLVVSEGAVNASADKFVIEIMGQQGHGARPHETLDAIVVGSLLVTALQTIVSREVDPAHPSVVSVGSFHAGGAHNVIAGRATLEGTIRSQHPEVRAHLTASIQRIAAAIGQLHRARCEVEIHAGTPPLINTPDMADIAREAAREVVGAERVTVMRTANMGGEDFAYYLQHVRGAYIRFGAQVPGRGSYPAHSSRFDFDESALVTGAAWLDRVARVAGRRLAEARAGG